MNGTQRRAAIEELLRHAEGPLSGSALAKQLGVSRQIIVGDVALLRAAGLDIAATPRGYVLLKQTTGLVRTVACVLPGESTFTPCAVPTRTAAAGCWLN